MKSQAQTSDVIFRKCDPKCQLKIVIFENENFMSNLGSEDQKIPKDQSENSKRSEGAKHEAGHRYVKTEIFH
jgi:hypothetical protein